MVLPLNLSSIPITDHHCHSLLLKQPKEPDEFRACFTEAVAPEVAREHVPHTIFYQWAQRALAELLGCEPTTEGIIAQRDAIGLNALVRKIIADANIRTWLVDYGYTPERIFAHEDLRSLLPCRVERILRLEPLIEQLIIECPDFSAMFEAYLHNLQDLRGQGWVAIKSVIAYRVGLEIGEPTREEAKADFLLVKEQARREGTLRIASKPLLDWLINAAIEQAHRQEFPIQIHTGFGNPNLDIAKANPALLRRVIHGDQYRGAKIVLLHASYPYARTLGYLTAIYPNVYADLGLAIPFAVGETYAVLRELLALAPANKVLYSSDAFFIPELFWLGAKLGRRTLGVVLGEYIAEGLIDERAARDIAEMILWRNAEQLYLQ